MKKLILSAMWSKVLLLTLICVGFIQAKAASTDLGAIELDKVYDLPYSEIKGTFTPTKSGTLLQDGGSDINIYTDAAHSRRWIASLKVMEAHMALPIPMK